MGVCVGMGLAGVVESEEGATPCAPVELCAGGAGWQGGGGLCWQEGGGTCAMTEIGPIKKEKEIFNTILMGIRRGGKDATAPLKGPDDARAVSLFYWPHSLDKQ